MRPTCLASIYALAKQDPRVVFIGSDIGHGLIDEYRRELPDQFFLEGISEQNLVGVAAGMAHEGKIVYLGMIAAFVRRCYEQIALDVALHNLPVRLVGFGGGVMYSKEGPTHTATDDVALMRNLGVTVIAPADRVELAALMPQTVDYPGPLYVRLGWGEPIVWDKPRTKDGATVAIITTGNMLDLCLQAQTWLEHWGVVADVIHRPFIESPLNEGVYEHYRFAVSVEEGIETNALAQAVDTVLSLPIFPEGYGARLEMLERYRMTGLQIARRIKDEYDRLF